MTKVRQPSLGLPVLIFASISNEHLFLCVYFYKHFFQSLQDSLRLEISHQLGYSFPVLPRTALTPHTAGQAFTTHASGLPLPYAGTQFQIHTVVLILVATASPSFAIFPPHLFELLFIYTYGWLKSNRHLYLKGGKFKMKAPECLISGEEMLLVL